MIADPPADELRDSARWCLEGGGAMGALMRATDWSRTGLGPVESWPASLRTSVSICLGSRFPLFVWWGPDLLMLYNDAYAEILGAKHPAALGAPGREVWQEVWPIIGPMFAGVMERGDATWSENLMLAAERRGYREECYFTFSYSPVRDGGRIVAVFCAVAETTQQVVGERRLAALRDLATAAAESDSADGACRRAAAVLAEHAVDAPFSLLYRLDGDGRRARLAGSSGLAPGGPLAPLEIALAGADDALWPLAAAVASGAAVDVENLAAHAPELPSAPWEEPVQQAVVQPIPSRLPGQLAGLLVLGVSPRRRLDASYRDFFGLVAGQLATGLANADAREAERQRAEALAQLDRAKTLFFSNVSHELRTPLTLILAPVEDALRDVTTTPETRQRLEAVQRNGLRLLKLVNSLLDFSRIEAGRVQASFEPTDVAALTADVASSFRSLVERAGVRFTIDCPRLSQPLWIDRAMWEKVVLNLVSNAFKHTFEGEIAVRVAAIPSSLGGGARLEVRDTGVGIAAVDQPHIFDRFFRVQDAGGRSVEGTGIGLALVRELVRLHGGDIAVESEPGRGSVFTVTVRAGRAHLPTTRIAGATALSSTAGGAGAYLEEASGWVGQHVGGTYDAGGLSGGELGEDAGAGDAELLVADDNADMRAYLARILAPLGAVTTVADGVEALALVRRRRFDLVLTDVMMPNLDGLSLLRELRADSATADVPVIVLSARAGEEAKIEGLQAGADDYVVKPFSSRELAVRVRSQIALARARHAVSEQRGELYRVLSQAPLAIAVLRGPDLAWELINDGYARLVPRARVGERLLDSLPELAGQGIVEMLDEVMHSGTPRVADERLIRLAARGSHELVDTFWTFVYAPLVRADGEADRVVVVAHEVSDQVKARRAAESANRAKDEFLAMLGHELRNPLSPIVTALHIMKLENREGSREREIIERQVKHVMRLVDDLLDVSRITRGGLTLERASVDLGEVVARALEMSGPLLEIRGHRVEVDVRDGLMVDGDAGRLAQVFANLLNNAAKYTPNGGQIRVTGGVVRGTARIEVRDDGVGIARELLPRVFDLFVQDRQHLDRARGGLGLGLAIVRSLVEAHGGSVTVTSDGPGTGTSFVVQLPLLAVPERPRVAPPGTVEAAGAPRRRRVLVVDDNADAARSLATAMRLMGYEVAVAHDAPAALVEAAAMPPDLGLLDIGLPVIDGYELAARLRTLPGCADIKLVAVTGYAQESDRRRSREAGFAEHLVKPVDLATVAAVADRLTATPPRPA